MLQLLLLDNAESLMAKRITTIHVGGGPCCGKTEILQAAQQQLTTKRTKVLTLPEMATLWHLAGFDYGALAVTGTPEQRIATQAAFARHWLAQLDAALMLARSYPAYNWIILTDRGPIEAKAYIGPDEFAQLCQRSGWSEDWLRCRCDAALHLRTAAFGQGYSAESNPARREQPHEARALDERLLAAMQGHPRLVVIDNSPDFQTKLQASLEAIGRLSS
jgi:hypothetical protein